MNSGITYLPGIPVATAMPSYREEKITLDPSETVANSGAVNVPSGIQYKFPTIGSNVEIRGGGLRTIRLGLGRGGLENMIITLIDVEGVRVAHQLPAIILARSIKRRETVYFAKGTIIDWRASYFEFVVDMPGDIKWTAILSYW